PQSLLRLQSGYASLQELGPSPPDAPRALHTVALPLVQALQRFESDGFRAFAERYAARDLLRGRAVRLTAPGPAEGVAEGVAADGTLQVRAGGTLHAISSAEVSVRLSDSPEPAPD